MNSQISDREPHQLGELHATYSSFFRRVIFVLCLSLLFLSACKTQPQTTAENTAAANTQAAQSTPVANTPAAPSGPIKVTQIDEKGLKDILKPNGKPLLINFWATWCGPCREEFPDLVKIAADHKDKVDVITVTLDEVSEINTEVPKFLTEMGSTSPTYLLKAADEDAAMAIVSKAWQGGLPFTILFNAAGEPIYTKQGKFKPDVLIAEIQKQ
jgi:thiol-disulfide isomerase/thioredoxin